MAARRRLPGRPEPANKSQVWREFEGTPAGALLRKVYSRSTAPTVAVPKPKTKAWQAPDKFIPAGGKVGVDAREQRIDHAEAAAVRVPVVGRPKRTHVAAIDALPIRRRGQGAIAAREAAAAATADRIAAPLTKPVSTEANKRRLQAINSLKGGKALPEELTAAPISGNIPLSVMSSSAVASHRRRKAGSAPHSPTAGPDSAELREMRSMFNAITRELAEEEATLRAAQRRVDAAAGDAGAAERGASEVAAALQAIRSKVGDMQRLDGLMREEKARLRGLTQAHG